MGLSATPEPGDRGDAGSAAEPVETAAVLLYDGVCGLCNRTVQFTLRHDHAGRFRFAPLQGSFARKALARYGKNAGDLDSVYVLADFGRPTEKLLARSDAILYVLGTIGGIWRLSALGYLVPRPVRSRVYDFIARRRYRWFGRYDSCVLPAAAQRKRFIDPA
jgi:predicted DCC family thiol-disulfide oxidoreductase YuxK